MYILSQFGDAALPLYNTEYDTSPVPAVLTFIQTTNGVFDGNGEGRSRQAFPLALSYKGVVAESVYASNKTTLDGLRRLVGTRAILYRYVDNAPTLIQTCIARLQAAPQTRPYSMRGYFEVTLNFQQLSPWFGVKRGTGFTFDSGVLFDNGRNFDEEAPTTLTGGVTLITITNNGNLSATDVTVSFHCGVDNLESLTVWNMTTNCRWFWTGIVSPATALEIDTGACSVVNAGIDDYNNFGIDDPFHRNEHWLELAPGANQIAVVRFGGGSTSTIAFVFNDVWA
jgi:hypothetical protein